MSSTIDAIEWHAHKQLADEALDVLARARNVHGYSPLELLGRLTVLAPEAVIKAVYETWPEVQR